jgi:hypothetical protein
MVSQHITGGLGFRYQLPLGRESIKGNTTRPELIQRMRLIGCHPWLSLRRPG